MYVCHTAYRHLRMCVNTYMRVWFDIHRHAHGLTGTCTLTTVPLQSSSATSMQTSQAALPTLCRLLWRESMRACSHRLELTYGWIFMGEAYYLYTSTCLPTCMGVGYSTREKITLFVSTMPSKWVQYGLEQQPCISVRLSVLVNVPAHWSI